MNDIYYMIIDSADLVNVDFSEILQTSPATVRTTLDESKAIVKWVGVTVPPSVNALTVKEGPYAHTNVLPKVEDVTWADMLTTNDGLSCSCGTTWNSVVSSTYLPNLIGAYDFRNHINGLVVSPIGIGPSLETSNVIQTNNGLFFKKGNNSWAFADETRPITPNHTLVYVARTNNTIDPENVLINNSPDRFGYTGMIVFSRSSQGLMPYNGNDNQQVGLTPNGTSWYFLACSFNGDDTVTYKRVSIQGTVTGTLPATTSTSYDGYLGVAAGFGATSVYGVTGIYRLAMFINQSFDANGLDYLYNTIKNGPAADLLTF